MTAMAMVMCGLLRAVVGSSSSSSSPSFAAGSAQHLWMDTRADPVARAHALLGAMTQEEKVHMLHGSGSGNYTGNVIENTRLGIPALRLNDGPQGFRADVAGTSTAWPSSLGTCTVITL